MSTAQRTSTVVGLRSRPPAAPVPRERPNLIALAVALVLAIGPLAFGFYSFTSWAPLGIGAIVLLVVLTFGPLPKLSGFGLGAAAGLGLLTVLSFASILWAESRDSAWTDANQIAVYAVVFTIGLLAIRRRATALATVLLIGLPAALSALVLAVEFAFGGGGGAFLQGRLQAPMGYINATAGLMVMGVWPWLGLAESAQTRWMRSTAISVAGLIAATAVLTQSRAIVLATIATVVLALLAADGRTRRGGNLLIVLASVLSTSHWTLRVYSSTGASQRLAPRGSALQQAGFALLATAALGFALKWLISVGVAKLPSDQRATLLRQGGRAMLAVTLALVLAGAVAGHSRISTQWHDFTALNGEQTAGNRFLAIGGGYRYDLWRIALDEFRDDPLGGAGAGNFADQYYRSRHQFEDVTVPHSLELQMLAELGVGGAIGLMVLLGPVLGAGLSRRRSLLTSGDPGLKIAALGVFTGWLAATSVDWLYDIPALTGMALFAAAILVARDPAPTDQSQPATGRASRRRRSALVATVALSALVAASLGRQYVAALYGNSGQALVTRNPLKALQKLRTAEQLDPWSMPTQYAVASAYARLGSYPSAHIALRHAEQLEPENYVPPALLGDIATRAGDRRTARAAYRRALSLDPLEPALKQALQKTERAA
jgi:tetratricopeptide (TPR) repeat protein